LRCPPPSELAERLDHIRARHATDLLPAETATLTCVANALRTTNRWGHVDRAMRAVDMLVRIGTTFGVLG